MKLRLIVLSAAALITSCLAIGGNINRAEVAKSIRREVSENWRSGYDEKQQSYLLISPAYPLKYDQGCIIYRQSFPDSGGKASFAEMDFYRLYYATAFGAECSKIDQGRFFAIQEGSDYYGTLDFVRRVYEGPKVGRDKISEKEIERLSACFASNGGSSTDVTRAESRPVPDADGIQYLITLRCRELEKLEEIFASGVDRRSEISWEIRTSAQVDVHDIND